MEGKSTITFKEVQTVIKNELDEIVRQAAQKMISAAIDIELSDFLNRYSGKSTANGQKAVVKNGYHKERQLTVNAGTVKVKIPRTRNRLGGENFQSILVPRYLKRSLTIDSAVPLLYLKGISTNDMEFALKELLGSSVEVLSASNVSRLKNIWGDEFNCWNKRDLSDKTYCYVWVDGIHFNLRLEEERLCILVMLGVNENGTKELIGIESGYRESNDSWSCFLRNLKIRKLKVPKLFIGDGALGFWSAVKDVYPESKWQRCWVHKMANILDKMPKKVQPNAKNMIHQMYMAPTKEEELGAYELFIKTFENKYPKAVECLAKNIDDLFTFYDFPAEHWIHIRSTNAIESTFATLRLRTAKTRGMGNARTAISMVFKLMTEAEKRYAKLKGHKHIPIVMEGRIFKDGELVEQVA
jgi:transposase-like protein